MYLVDTNVWLERLLDQEKARDVADFLDKVNSNDLYLTDFTYHSIGIIMAKLNRKADFLVFTKDLFQNGLVTILSLTPSDAEKIMNAIDKFGIDFDDAYQLETARQYRLKIISFDSDFEKTDLKAKQPNDL